MQAVQAAVGSVFHPTVFTHRPFLNDCAALWRQNVTVGRAVRRAVGASVGCSVAIFRFSVLVCSAVLFCGGWGRRGPAVDIDNTQSAVSDKICLVLVECNVTLLCTTCNKKVIQFII